MIRTMRSVLFFSFLLFSCSQLMFASSPKLKPFYLAYKKASNAQTEVAAVKKSLTENGFEIVGTYSPYPTTTIVVVTTDALKKMAARTKHGGFGAAQRVAVTDVNGETQVSYTNPIYMAAVYRMKGDAQATLDQLSRALGQDTAYGCVEECNDADDLEDYQYMFGMPDFEDEDVLARSGSYEEAMQRVTAGLAAGKGGVSKVFQIDIPGKEETLIGVGMTQKLSADAFIMKTIDFKPIKSSAHLPYEILVTGKRAIALSAKFRIALSFPDLAMTGDNSFMDIMSSPGEIADVLKAAARNK